MATDALLALMGSRTGHFLLESGNHGDRWLELDGLFAEPDRIASFVRELAAQLVSHEIEAVCGPVLGGAVLARLIARELRLSVCEAQRVAVAGAPVAYRIDDRVACAVAGLRVAVVDDVIGAGSAVVATLAELRRLQAIPVVIGTFLESGLAPGVLAGRTGLPVVSLGRLETGMWAPAACPLCRQQVPLEVPGAIA